MLILLFSWLGFASVDQHQMFKDPQLQLSLRVSHPEWTILSADQIPKKNADDEMLLRFAARGPTNAQGVQPTFTLRVDPGLWKSAKHYSEKWLKEYPKFGYELRFSRENKIGNLNGFEMELISTTNSRLVRQFVIHRPKEMWVFTCSSDSESFRSAWEVCNSMLKSAKLN